ncbi:VanZ family protein [Shinella daejeonensis]|nr:VanZ family protein [Shinella daejeonensis]
MQDIMTIRILAWLVLAGILFATVSPIGLRPPVTLSVNADRALAFAGMSFLFVLAYPRAALRVCVAMLAGVAAFELLQYLSPTRHPGMIDALAKMGGVIAGGLAGVLFLRLLRRRRRQRR